MNRTKVVISVISDLNTDQRVQKIASSLQREIGDVTVICRSSKNTSPSFPYVVKRLKIISKGGFAFYAEFNIRLFFKLLFNKANIYVANDADTLLPNFYVSKLFRKHLVFDSHEIMSEVPEVVSRPRIKKIWQHIERYYIPKVKYKYTVCKALMNHYKCGFKVVRNVPYSLASNKTFNNNNKRKVILYQGSVNTARGIETMIKAMPYIKNCEFWVVGDGYELNAIKSLVEQLHLGDKVIFKGNFLPEKLKEITPLANLGISIEENVGLNYFYALPNKLMDYIQHNVPVLVSDFPEMSAIVSKYNIGETVISREPEQLAVQISRMLADESLNCIWKNNLKLAARELCWENEEKILISIYSEILKN